jgi:hypothetical protein
MYFIDQKKKGIKADRKTDTNGKNYDDYWPSAKRVIHFNLKTSSHCIIF